jgi:hypothetical protein
MTTTCRNCGTPVPGKGWCIDCVRAYSKGALEMLGGLTVSAAVSFLVRWWWS